MRNVYFFLLSFLFLGVLLTLSGCRKDNDFPPDSNKSDFVVRKTTFEQISKISKVNQKLDKIKKAFKTDNSTSARIDANDGSFTINTDEILETIYQDSISTYTFRMDAQLYENALFENFVLFPSLEQPYYILSYFPTEHEQDEFPYIIEKTMITEEQINSSDLQSYINASTAPQEQVYDCWITEYVWEVNDWSWASDGQWVAVWECGWVNSGGGNSANDGDYWGGSDSSDNTSEAEGDGGTSGGSSSGTNSENTDTQDYLHGGVGVLEPDQQEQSPCDEIATQISNPEFMAKIDSLKTKTGDSKETGFREDIGDPNNTYTEENQTLANGHSLIVHTNNKTIGFSHTHLDDFEEVTESDSYSETIDTNNPIRMFSPRDVLNLLVLVNNANTQERPISDCYINMITSNSFYTIRYEGEIDLPAFNAFGSNQVTLKNKYKEKMEDVYSKSGLEKQFLKFMKKHLDVGGLKLYLIEDDGTIIEKTLSDDGRSVEDIPCNN
jgi:hypothetical protein